MTTEAKGAELPLSPKMEKELCRWQLRFAGIDNPTANALKKRGLVQWAPPAWGWGRPEGVWLLTEKGNQVRATLKKAGAKTP